MDCTTKYVDRENGQLIDKPKKTYNDLESAIKVAKIENSKKERTFKVVAYKCKTCHKFHVGRNGNTIKDKEKTKWSKKEIKVVGFIKLK